MSNPNKINVGHFGANHHPDGEKDEKKKGVFGGLFKKKSKDDKVDKDSSPASPSTPSPTPVPPPTQTVQAQPQPQAAPVQLPPPPVVQQIKPVANPPSPKPVESPKPVAAVQPVPVTPVVAPIKNVTTTTITTKSQPQPTTYPQAPPKETVMQETIIPPRQQPFAPAPPIHNETVMQEIPVPTKPQYYAPPPAAPVVRNEVVMNELPVPPRPVHNEITMNEIPVPRIPPQTTPSPYGGNSGYRGNQFSSPAPNDELVMNELPVPSRPSPYSNTYDNTVMNELPAPTPTPLGAVDDEFSKHLNNLTSALDNIKTGVDEWKHRVPPPTMTETTTTNVKSTAYGTTFNVAKARKEEAQNLESVEIYMKRYGYEKMRDAAVEWMYEITQDHHLVSKSFEEAVASGVVLAKLINVIKPSFVSINNTGTPAAKKDTVNNVINAVKRLGIPETQSFKANDVLDSKDLHQLVVCLHAINRYALLLTGFEGPFIRDDIEAAESIHKVSLKRNWNQNPNAAVPLFEATANKGANQKLDVVRETAHFTGSYGPGETRIVETETITEVTEFTRVPGGAVKQVAHTKTVVKDDPPIKK